MQFFGGVKLVINGLIQGVGQAFNIRNYIKVINFYKQDFNVPEWVFVSLAILLLLLILALIVFVGYLLVRKLIRVRKTLVEQEELLEEVATLNDEVSTLVKEKVKPKRKLKTWEIVLLILGSPLWIPLLLAFLIVLLSVYVVIWSAVICMYAVDLTFLVGAVAGLIGIFSYLKAGNPVGALFSLGTGTACTGLAILMFFVCIWTAKSVIRVTGKVILGIKILFVGKEE